MEPYLGGKKLPRNILHKRILKGGLSISDLQIRSKANIIQLLCKIRNNFNQPSSALFVYWFGFSLRDAYPSLSSYKYVHTIDIPNNFTHIKEIITKYT